jgi:DNA primase
MIKLATEQIEKWVSTQFQYKKRSHGRQIIINNPFGDDGDYHLWISTTETPLKKGPRKGHMGYWVIDHRPGKFKGSLFKFVMEYKKCSYSQAVSELTSARGKDLKYLLRQNRQPEEKEVPESTIKIPDFSKPISVDSKELANTAARNYLHGREIRDDVIISALLHYTPVSIVFPYLEYGEIVFWQERELLNKRFLFPDENKTGLAKTDYLYGFDNVEPKEDVIVVESIFNCLSIGADCVATGGATISGKQPQKMRALLPRYVVLAPDNDKAGKQSLVKNYFLLKDSFKLGFCLPPKDLDWNDMDRMYGPGTARSHIEAKSDVLTLSKISSLIMV